MLLSGIAPEAFTVASRTPPDDLDTFSAAELTRFNIRTRR
jgi:hypothetical protein